MRSLLPAPQCGSVNAGISQRAGAFAMLKTQFSLLPFALLLVNSDAVTLAVIGPIHFWKQCALSLVNTSACMCYREHSRNTLTVLFGAQCVAVALLSLTTSSYSNWSIWCAMCGGCSDWGKIRSRPLLGQPTLVA